MRLSPNVFFGDSTLGIPAKARINPLSLREYAGLENEDSRYSLAAFAYAASPDSFC
jgi:hypothetical protein